MKLITLLAALLATISSTYCWSDLRIGGRIVGGVNITIEVAPYQASLLHGLVEYLHICGGAIISKNFVITAAHCMIYPIQEYIVRVGSTASLEGGDVHEISRFLIHPQFNRNLLDYDVSLLQLKTSIEIDNWTKKVIPLPLFGEVLPEGTAVVVSGWGLTQNPTESNLYLRAVILNIMNQQECNRQYANEGGITIRMVCASAANKDSCNGDSGGPVRRLSDGKLVGLVSFGPNDQSCANSDYFGVYTRLAAVRPWIYVNARV